MSKSVRTVRFNELELKRIEEFLKVNTFLDFSTLTRMALNEFIQNPTVQIKAIPNLKKSFGRAAAHVTI